jgi:hypothetical protein
MWSVKEKYRKTYEGDYSEEAQADINAMSDALHKRTIVQFNGVPCLVTLVEVSFMTSSFTAYKIELTRVEEQDV